MKRLVVFLAFACLALSPAIASATGWRTKQPVVMYDGPSAQAHPLRILTGGFPLKQVSSLHGWYKVVSHSGDIGWVAADDLKKSTDVVVVVDRAAVRADPNPAAAAVFFARRDVVLEVLSGAGGSGGWLKVLHEDGEVGYLLETDGWLNSQ